MPQHVGQGTKAESSTDRRILDMLKRPDVPSAMRDELIVTLATAAHIAGVKMRRVVEIRDWLSDWTDDDAKHRTWQEGLEEWSPSCLKKRIEREHSRFGRGLLTNEITFDEAEKTTYRLCFNKALKLCENLRKIGKTPPPLSHVSNFQQLLAWCAECPEADVPPPGAEAQAGRGTGKLSMAESDLPALKALLEAYLGPGFSVERVQKEKQQTGHSPKGNGKKRIPKNAVQQANIKKLEECLKRHVRAAKDFAFSLKQSGHAPRLLEIPQKKFLAKECGWTGKEHIVTRCFKKSSECRSLYAKLDNLDALMGDGKSPVASSTCPSCNELHSFHCMRQIARRQTMGAVRNATMRLFTA